MVDSQLTNQEDGNLSESSSGRSDYSRGMMFRGNRRAFSGTFFELIKVKNNSPIKKAKRRQTESLGLITVEETKNIFEFLYFNNLLNYMKGKAVARLIRHLKVSA